MWSPFAFQGVINEQNKICVLVFWPGIVFAVYASFAFVEPIRTASLQWLAWFYFSVAPVIFFALKDLWKDEK